jgi:hypothetical protein
VLRCNDRYLENDPDGSSINSSISGSLFMSLSFFNAQSYFPYLSHYGKIDNMASRQEGVSVTKR